MKLTISEAVNIIKYEYDLGMQTCCLGCSKDFVEGEMIVQDEDYWCLMCELSFRCWCRFLMKDPGQKEIDLSWLLIYEK